MEAQPRLGAVRPIAKRDQARRCLEAIRETSTTALAEAAGGRCGVIRVASGFVLKDAEPAELLRAVRVVAAGEAVLSPSVTRRVASLFGRHWPGDALGTRPGCADRPGARAAGVGGHRAVQPGDRRGAVPQPATVRTHISRAMGKLGAGDRAQLVVFAVRAGLTLPEE